MLYNTTFGGKMTDVCKNWTTWLKSTRFAYLNEEQLQQTILWLSTIRDEVLTLADLKENQKIADFGCGSGLLAFGVLEKFQDRVELIFSDKFQDCLDECQNILNTSSCPHNVSFLQSDIIDIKLKNDYLDRALTRSVLVHVLDKQSAFNELYRVLKPGGYYCAFEPIISQNTRYYELTNESQLSDYCDFKIAEKEFMESLDDPLVNFNFESLNENIKIAGFSDINLDLKVVSSKYIPQKEAVASWFTLPPSPGQKTMKDRFLAYFDEKKVDNYIEEIQQALSGREICVNTKTALIKAGK